MTKGFNKAEHLHDSMEPCGEATKDDYIDELETRLERAEFKIGDLIEDVENMALDLNNASNLLMRTRMEGFEWEEGDGYFIDCLIEEYGGGGTD